MNRYCNFLVSLVALAIVGCASTDVPDPEPESNDTDLSASTNTFDDDGLDDGQAFSDPEPAELETVVYFDYDTADLKPEYADLLASHASRLSDGGRIQVRLEGHADERGSREYNIGLGERRSQAVRRVLLNHGVSLEQVSTVSYGEERPIAQGSGEESYALNRRVEIRYLN